jgi:hypothetical protein
VGGGLGWFYYPYHKNINETLILQNFYDDFCEELPIGDEVGEKVGGNFDKGIRSYDLNSTYRFY